MAAAPEPLILLIVDDDQTDVLIIERALSRLGTPVKCHSVTDGDEAKDYLAGDGPYTNRTVWPFPHVLLLDYWMPRVSGLDVLSWVRGRHESASLPVVMLSGGLAPAQQQAAAELDAVFCHKGVATDEFADVLIQAMRKALEQVDTRTPNAATR